jgi:uncharacterized membrane protein HdeD (DUF308 family)
MKIMHKIAAALSFLIGIISVIAGSLVLLNYEVPDYTILNWLVIYNIILGIVSVVAAILIWKYTESAKKLIAVILIFHTLVLAYLYFFSQEVALESIKAMGFRVSVWTVILLLTYKKKNI